MCEAWIIVNETGRSISADSFAIQSISRMRRLGRTLARGALRSHFEYGPTAGRHRAAQTEQLGLGRVRARDRLAVDGAVPLGA